MTRDQQKRCTVTGCASPLAWGGMCRAHRARFKRKGTTDLNQRPSDSERFWRLVTKTDECWVWGGAKDPKGYGRFRLHGKAKLAHRVAFEMLRGSADPALVIDHLCRNPPCVNPAHMELVTTGENTRRGNAGKNKRKAGSL